VNDEVDSLTDPKNWRIDDPRPGVPLTEIHPHSSRAWALLSRSKERDVVHQHLIRIVGAIDMLAGLEYHRANFCRTVAELAFIPMSHPAASERHLSLVHEAVAYLNRLGQFYYFASSHSVEETVPGWRNTIPTIVEFKRFRDKHSAHRSLDAPRPDDKPFTQQVHALALSSLGGWLFHPKPGRTPLTLPDDFRSPHRHWVDCYVLVQRELDNYYGQPSG